MKQKSLTKKIGSLTLILFTLSLKIAFAQSDISAIDILLDPDQKMLDSAKILNATLIQNYPDGFVLDATHAPHITVYQVFVHTSDLDKVYAAVEKVVKSEQPVKQTLTATGLYYLPYKNLGLAGITIKPTAELLKFQEKIIEALKPYTVQGTGSAFVPRSDGGAISQPTVDYVAAFVPEHNGINYNPHVTIGLGLESFIKEMLNKHFNQFTFKSQSVSIYQLGDLGTAQKKLWSTTDTK